MIVVPDRLADACRDNPERMHWLEQLPSAVDGLRRRWSLSLGTAWTGPEGSCSWIAPAERRSGERVVLKLGMPHMEAADEAEGLRFWDGEPTVRLLESDAALNAMLLERCEPGTPLRDRPESEQDEVIAGLLHRLWRKPSASHSFRPLSAMLTYWSRETMAAAERWVDGNLVRAGLKLFAELSVSSGNDVLLATDLHAGNVLRAQRKPWLVIDPKPFVGDAAYDATQHLLNCRDRVGADPDRTIGRFADMLDLDGDRMRRWLFARAAAEPRDDWSNELLDLARALA